MITIPDTRQRSARLPAMDILPPPPALPAASTGQDTAPAVVATDREIETARIYLDASRAASTRRAYAGD